MSQARTFAVPVPENVSNTAGTLRLYTVATRYTISWKISYYGLVLMVFIGHARQSSIGYTGSGTDLCCPISRVGELALA